MNWMSPEAKEVYTTTHPANSPVAAMLLIADRLANLAVTVDYIDRTLNDRLMGLTEAVGHLRDGLDEIDRTIERKL